MSSKKIDIMIVPHDQGKTRNFRVSYRLIYTTVTITVLFLLSIIAFFANYGRILVAAERGATLGRENARLRHQVAQVDSLQMELLNLQSMSLQVKRMLGVKLSYEDSVLVASMSPDDKRPAINLDDSVELVGQKEQKIMLDALPTMWPVRGYVTRAFSTTGGEKNPSYHPGMDIAADRNTPIRAAANGVVDASRHDETYGWVVEIDHGYGIHSLYGHNTRNLVKVGDRVTRGMTIAFLGSTGKSTAPHVHFEVQKNGVPVNPKEYLLN